MKKEIVQRTFKADENHTLKHLHPVLQRIYRARDIHTQEQLDHSLSGLPSPWLLTGMDDMVEQLIEAIRNDRKILIVADYDADGATSCAVAKLGLSLLGANHVSYIVPNRFEFGYGLTRELVQAARRYNPDLLITVDNGIASVDGVDAAHEEGWKVLITDHHLPGEVIPKADAIVNPNLSDSQFPSKSLAGVGVMFYVLMGLRARLREMGWFTKNGKTPPNLAQLLDYVALGTVADLVPLDHINRILVQQGLSRIRSNRAHPGILALFKVAKRSTDNLICSDLGYAVAPRLNAAGRLDDMSQGIECLLARDDETARELAINLDRLNSERREIEQQMKIEALRLIDGMDFDGKLENCSGICLFDKSWHQGVIGILASRVKEKFHRPVIIFAPANEREIRGSARSIAGVHIRDVLCDIASKHPALLKKFGGHAMAAGLTLDKEDYPTFVAAFEDVVCTHLNGIELNNIVWTDGSLDDDLIDLEFAEMLRKSAPWGQGFPEPLFHGDFDVIQVRVIKDQHLKLILQSPDKEKSVDAIAFFVDNPEGWLRCDAVKIAYRLDINDYRNSRTTQLIIEHIERLPD